MSSRPKQLEDLPHFLVKGLKQEAVDAEGYIPLELSGTFNTLEGVREGRCWLLQSDKQSLIGDISLLDASTNAALYRMRAKTVPALLGRKLPYLDDFWQAYHVWMVTDLTEVWRELVFHACDAVSDRFEDGSGNRWTRFRKARPEDSHNPELQIVQNGWDHEHCELCNAHIDPGDCCYRSATDCWVCQGCYQQFVQRHDLSFIDRL